jgi:hypothetical protein
MRWPTGLAVGTGLVMACTDRAATEPEGLESSVSEAALAANTWTPKAARPGSGVLYQTFAGTAPNAAGQSIVYVFGGTSDQGGTGFQSSAYNVSTDTWSGGLARVGSFAANGVGKIADRLYFSGGYNEVETPESFTNRLWEYDYANDRLITKAPLPIFGTEGVSGVISGKLYVLPGACSGDLWPVDPRYCAEEPTRRLFRYNPATDTWMSKRQAPHVHRAGAGAVMSGKLYVVGGSTASIRSRPWTSTIRARTPGGRWLPFPSPAAPSAPCYKGSSTCWWAPSTTPTTRRPTGGAHSRPRSSDTMRSSRCS